MINHPIQKHIVRHLMTHPRARFTELKPKNLDNNIFTYHLHQLMTEKLVIKNEDGFYELAPHCHGTNIINKQSLLEPTKLS